ncbi:MAG: hypothetical protein Q8Q62_04750 [Mesorhizobium sp.]|nr:hypothetical protein [Mesorhizobium sp.]
MAEFLTALEQFAPIRALKASFIAYPLVNALHIAAIGALWTSIALMDLRVLGAFRALPEPAFLATLRRVALIAFALAVASGLTLFAVRAGHYAGMPAFLIKMGLILLAGLNLVAFQRFVQSPRSQRAPKLAAIASLVLWTAVLICGRFIGFL